jgi:hypothetical protein
VTESTLPLVELGANIGAEPKAFTPGRGQR